MITKVYRYGLLPPSDNAETVRRHVRLAHEYRNKLVEIDRAERAEVRALQVSPVLEAAAASAKLAKETAYSAIKAYKGKERTRKVPEALATPYKTAEAAHRDAAKALAEARRALRADPTVALRRDQIELRYNEERKKARAASGVYWGTYLRTEAADRQAREDTPLWKGTTPNDVRFARWRGDGAVAVQIQSGPAPGELDANTYCRIEPAPLPKGADPTSKRSAQRRYATLLLRIGSDGRQPIWARWPLVMHRPLPENATISWVTVLLRNIGPREEWSVHFTVKYEDSRSVPQLAANRLAVDIGWRKMGETVRVATWRNDAGEVGTVVLDEDMIGQSRRADSLRKTRDENLNAARAVLVAQAKNLVLPDWFPKNVWQWEAPARFVSLVRRWRDARFDGDAEAYEALEAWRYHDHHLWAWETSQRTKALRHRLDFYRNFAARMARTYSSLVLEDFDLRYVAKRPEAHEQEGDNAKARAQRQRVATSELRKVLVEAFRGDVAKVPAEYTTKTCAECGSVETWDQAAELEHTCVACGAHWDQDHNATKNLLAYRERPDGEDPPGAAREAEKTGENVEVQESGWAKAKRMGREKRARVEAAREADPKAAE